MIMLSLTRVIRKTKAGRLDCENHGNKCIKFDLTITISNNQKHHGFY